MKAPIVDAQYITAEKTDRSPLLLGGTSTSQYMRLKILDLQLLLKIPVTLARALQAAVLRIIDPGSLGSPRAGVFYFAPSPMPKGLIDIS